MEKRMKSVFVLWLPVVIWAMVIFGLSSFSTLPGSELIWWDFIIKKTGHMFVYGVLFFLLQRAIGGDGKDKINKKGVNLFISFLITFLYAISDEYHQSFVPGRTALISDVGYDMIGALLVLMRLKKFI